MKWSAAEDSVLLAIYADTLTSLVAQKVGRTASSTYQRARKLGLKKSDSYLRSEVAGRLDSVKGALCRFQKGQRAWNDGMKGLDIGGKETRFKAGSKPQTWRPIGSERISKDGYLQRKATDSGYSTRDWVGVHILVWSAANGEVPKGHAVVFKDGDKRNFSIENLECISRSELMRRNTVHNYPPEIAKAVQLIGALNRKINHGKQH